MAASGKRVEVAGINALARSLKAAPEDLQERFKAVNLNAAQTVRATALPLVPVESGALRATVRASATLRSGRVRAGNKKVPYAGVVHWGWGRRNIHPQTFLTTALDREREQVLDDFLEATEAMTELVVSEVNNG